MTGEGQQFIPLGAVGVGDYSLSKPEANLFENRLAHPVAESEYIVPNATAVNSQRLAEILSKMIENESKSKINHQSPDWILEKWKAGHGVMVLVHEADEKPVDIFNNADLSDDDLRAHILAAAFIKQLDRPMEEKVELGTVISNPAYRSHKERRLRSLGGGKLAFQAVQDRAHQLFPQAEILTWVHDGSKNSAEAAFGHNLKSHEVIIDPNEEPERFEEVYGVCRRTCPNFHKDTNTCCHTEHKVTNEALNLIHERPLQVE